MKDTIIFCSDHYAALSQCIAITAMGRKSNRIIFLTSIDDEEQVSCLEGLQSKGVLEYSLYDHRVLCSETDKNTLFHEIELYFTKIYSRLGVDPGDVKKIYLCNSSAYTPFGLYLTYVGREYSLVEFAKDEFITRKLEKSLLSYSKMSSAYREAILDSGAIVGNNKLCVEHIYQMDSTINDDYSGINSKVDFANLLVELDEELKKDVAEIFSLNIQKLFDAPQTLLLSNSYDFTLRAFKRENQNYINNPIAPYTLLVDLSNTKLPILIKPHPYGIFEFEKYFYDCTVLMKSFPIEFINMYRDIKIHSTLSIETNAAYRIREKTQNFLSVSRDYLWQFKNVLFIWIASLLSLKTDKHVVILTNSVDEFRTIASFFSKQLELPSEKHVIVTNMLLHKNEQTIYLTKELELLPHNSNYRYLYIEKKNVESKDSVLLDGRETLYLMGNIDIKELSITVSLKYSNLIVSLKGG